MNINELTEMKGYESNTVRICKFLGFNDTDQLKSAHFFSQEESYSPIPIPGICISNGDMTWRECRVDNDVSELFSVDHGYKIVLKICDGSGYGTHKYYQSDFYSLLKSGHILLKTSENSHIEKIQWTESIGGSAYLVHSADVVVEG